MAKTKELLVVMKSRNDQLLAGIRQANQALESVQKSASNVSAAFSSLRALAATAFIGISGGAVVREFVQVGIAVEKMRASLETVTGSQTEAARVTEFLRQESDRLGLSFQEQSKSYIALAASSRGTRLEGEETKKLWSAMAVASSALGMSTAQSSQAMVALSQIISKGRVSAEELRGQMAEALPGSFQIAARAMGKTTAELDKMLQSGSILSTDFIPKFSKQIQEELGGSVQKTAHTLASEWNRLKNVLFDFQAQVMGAGGGTNALAQALGQAAQDLRAFLDAHKPEIIDSTAKAIAGLQDTLRTFSSIIGSLGLGTSVDLGIIGYILFGKMGFLKVIAIVAEVDRVMSYLGAGISDIAGKLQELRDAIISIDEVMGGRRSMDTGAPMFRAPMPQPEPRRFKIFGEEEDRYLGAWQSWRKVEKEASDAALQVLEANRAGITGIVSEIRRPLEDWEQDVKRAEQQAQESLTAVTALERELQTREATLSRLGDPQKEEDMAKVERELQARLELEKEARERLEREWKHTFERIQDATADLLSDIFQGKVDSWSDMLDRMKGLFFDWVAEIASKEIVFKLLPQMLGFTGLSYPGTATATTGTGGIGSAFSWIKEQLGRQAAQTGPVYPAAAPTKQGSPFAQLGERTSVYATPSVLTGAALGYDYNYGAGYGADYLMGQEYQPQAYQPQVYQAPQWAATPSVYGTAAAPAMTYPADYLMGPSQSGLWDQVSSAKTLSQLFSTWNLSGSSSAGVFSALPQGGYNYFAPADYGIGAGADYLMGSVPSGLSPAAMQGIAGVGALGGAMLMSYGQKKQSKGMSAAGGAISGASMGFMVGGPYGAAIGAVVGGIAGLMGAGKKENKFTLSELTGYGYMPGTWQKGVGLTSNIAPAGGSHWYNDIANQYTTGVKGLVDQFNQQVFDILKVVPKDIGDLLEQRLSQTSFTYTASGSWGVSQAQEAVQSQLQAYQAFMKSQFEGIIPAADLTQLQNLYTQKQQVESVLQPAWAGFTKSMELGDLAPVQSIESYTKYYEDMRLAAKESPEKGAEYLQYLQSQYMPFMKSWTGEGAEYKDIFADVVSQGGDVYTSVFTPLTDVSVKLDEIADKIEQALKNPTPIQLNVNIDGTQVAQVLAHQADIGGWDPGASAGY